MGGWRRMSNGDRGLQSDLFENHQGDYTAGATFDGPYRYRLWRCWKSSYVTGDIPRLVCWIMLNPSTADAKILDPTVRKCVGFSKRWGFDGLDVVNIFALKSTDPKALYTHDNPIGAWNDRAILQAVARASRVIVAFGHHGALHDRGRAVQRLLNAQAPDKTLLCLGTTQDGWPKHPLYPPYTTPLVEWGTA